ncbi:MAG: mismatch repair protein, partial [Mucilaginibacter sp.]|nr:mismatch repair protein [Mucilaginibacter sp.]
MSFTTDKQTLEDLNIYGRPGSDSIYALYNRTHTVNGAAILEEMFRHPLSDVNKINERIRLIRHLFVIQIDFPFKTELFDRAEQYLGNTDERTRLSSERQSLEKKLTNLVAVNADDKVIYNGITALVEIIQQLKIFINMLHSVNERPYQTHQGTLEVSNLLSSDFIVALAQEDTKNKIPYDKLVVWDNGLRFRQREQMKSILHYIYHMDVYITIAKVATERNFVFPKALPREEHVIKIGGFYHPQ